MHTNMHFFLYTDRIKPIGLNEKGAKSQLKSYGESRMRRNRTRKNKGGANCKIGVLFPRFGGGGCGCSMAAKPMMTLPPGITQGPLTLGLMKGGVASNCMSCGAPPPPPPSSELLRGGSCGCQAVPKIPSPLQGGYRATKRNLKYLRKLKRGESIGFTMRSSLKAKGLIPRANGKKRVSAKYR